MRAIDTAVARVLDDTEWTEFEINERDTDGEIVRTVSCRAALPEDGQVLAVMASMSRSAGTPEKIAGVVDLLNGILDEQSWNYVYGRLIERGDSFGPSDFMGILNALVEEWGARPTKQPTDFVPSHKSGGKKSTRRTPQ